MKRILLLSAIAAIVGCSASVTSAERLEDFHSDTLVIKGPLRMELSDMLANPGILFALPSISAQSGAVVVEQTQYGSLCSTNLHPEANVQAGRITLTLNYFGTLRLCTAEIRAIRYKATISAPAGTYTVAVVRVENNKSDTLRKESVVVR